jgi:hypothetical protein
MPANHQNYLAYSNPGMDSYGRTHKPVMPLLEVEPLDTEHFDLEDMIRESKEQSKKQTNDSENNKATNGNRDKYGRLFNSTNSSNNSTYNN